MIVVLAPVKHWIERYLPSRCSRICRSDAIFTRSFPRSFGDALLSFTAPLIAILVVDVVDKWDVTTVIIFWGMGVGWALAWGCMWSVLAWRSRMWRSLIKTGRRRTPIAQCLLQPLHLQLPDPSQHELLTYLVDVVVVKGVDVRLGSRAVFHENVPHLAKSGVHFLEELTEELEELRHLPAQHRQWGGEMRGGGGSCDHWGGAGGGAPRTRHERPPLQSPPLSRHVLSGEIPYFVDFLIL